MTSKNSEHQPLLTPSDRPSNIPSSNIDNNTAAGISMSSNVIHQEQVEQRAHNRSYDNQLFIPLKESTSDFASATFAREKSEHHQLSTESHILSSLPQSNACTDSLDMLSFISQTIDQALAEEQKPSGSSDYLLSPQTSVPSGNSLCHQKRRNSMDLLLLISKTIHQELTTGLDSSLPVLEEHETLAELEQDHDPLSFNMIHAMWNNEENFEADAKPPALPHPEEKLSRCSSPNKNSDQSDESTVSSSQVPSHEHVGTSMTSTMNLENAKADSSPLEDETRKRQRVFQEMKKLCNVTDKDILLGKGGFSAHHPGNKMYMNLIRKVRPLYFSLSSKAKKTEVSTEIVSKMMSNGSRFMQRSATTGRWAELNAKYARKKVSQALRERR